MNERSRKLGREQPVLKYENDGKSVMYELI